MHYVDSLLFLVCQNITSTFTKANFVSIFDRLLRNKKKKTILKIINLTISNNNFCCISKQNFVSKPKILLEKTKKLFVMLSKFCSAVGLLKTLLSKQNFLFRKQIFCFQNKNFCFKNKHYVLNAKKLVLKN